MRDPPEGNTDQLGGVVSGLASSSGGCQGLVADVEGLSTQEAAEIAGIRQAAFKSRLHQARLRVRAAIGDQTLASTGG